MTERAFSWVSSESLALLSVQKSSDEEKEISSKSIVQRKILFYPGKIFKDTLADMSITRRAEIETDYTDGSSNGGNTGGKPGSGDDGKGEGGVTPDPAV